MELLWPDHYPSPISLRHEVECMVAAVVEVLLDPALSLGVTGVYLKGSAQKRWDSAIDYVPEVSDVDVHVLFGDEASIERGLGTVEQAMAVQSRVEDGYRAKVRDPIHMPRPQMVILNRLLRDTDYSPSPRHAVTTIHGEDYPESAFDEERERELARRSLFSHAEVLQALPLRVIDKPGRYLLAVIRDLTWRVSPTGPRVLSLLGVPSAQAWSLNRTGVADAVKRLGQERFAKAYIDFYLAAWACFLSRYEDSEAARKAVAGGCEVLRTGAAIAELAMPRADAG
jgi:hypothetical protein